MLTALEPLMSVYANNEVQLFLSLVSGADLSLLQKN